MDTEADRGRFSLNINTISIVTTLLLTCINAAITAYSAKSDITKKEFDSYDMTRNYNVRVIELILNSIESSDERKQKIALGLAKNIQDEKLRTTLISALATQGTPIVKLKIKQEIRQNKIQISRQNTGIIEDMDSDFSKLKRSIFYCGTFPEQEGVARAHAGDSMYNVIRFEKLSHSEQQKIFSSSNITNLIVFNKQDRRLVESYELDLSTSVNTPFQLKSGEIEKGTLAVYFCGPTAYQADEEYDKITS